MLALLLVSAAAGACGSETPRSPADPASTQQTTTARARPPEPSSVDPCSLITRREAEHMAGRRLRSVRERRLRQGIETCARAVGDTGLFVTVIHGARDKRTFLAETRKIPDALPLEGLADGAVYGEDAGCIRALSGTVDFSVCGRRDGRPLDLTVLRSLTQRALSRIG